MADYRALIASLGDSLTEGAIAFDDEGIATFEAADGVVVDIDHLPESNQILLHADLGALPPGTASTALMRDLLADNLALCDLGGALAVEGETGSVALFARHGTAGLDQEAFEAWVGDLAATAGTWIRRLSLPVQAR